MNPSATLPTIATERLGFQREGLFRERWLVGGETQDSLMLGLLRHEWLSMRQSAGESGVGHGERNDRG